MTLALYCAVGINAVFMQTYIAKVSCPYICGKQLDHGVLLVGYGSAGYAPIWFKEKPFWILKNSWEKTGERMDITRSVRVVTYVKWGFVHDSSILGGIIIEM